MDIDDGRPDHHAADTSCDSSSADPSGAEPPVTAAEVRGWLDEENRLLTLTQSLRRRYLAADGDERREIAREACVRGLPEINTTIRNCRQRIAGYERLLAELTRGGSDG